MPCIPRERTSGALVALSGGVDSSIALALALEHGGSVRAAYLDTSGRGPDPHAEAVAAVLGVPFMVIEAALLFREDVILPSAGLLMRGMTPNPCMLCNREIKLGLLGRLLQPGEVLVTGHYAGRSPVGIKRGIDPAKDQSYFLALACGEFVRRCEFPLACMKKSGVRALAESLGLPFRTRESMDLCFDLPGSVRSSGPGPLLDTCGRKIGEHRGVENFTIGQRSGLGAFGRRLYTVSIDPGSNTVVAGGREDLLSDGCKVTGCNWYDPSGSPAAGEYLVQTRHRRIPVQAHIEPDHETGSLRIRFSRQEEAVAPGQVCAVYLDDELLGGGFISSTFREDGP
jgi:tRNA-uridine 2-sulfurtransferase